MGFKSDWFYLATIVFVFTSSDVRASPCGRRDKVQMTVMSFKNQDSASTRAPLPHFECYLGREDGGAIIKARRAYRTKFGGDQRPQPTLDSNITGLPGGTFAQSFALNITDNGAFGVFSCCATEDSRQNTTIMTIFMRRDRYVAPKDRMFTQTVDIQDERVIVDMDQINVDEKFVWRINGSAYVQSPSNGFYSSEDYRLISDRPVNVNDEGVYECHIDRRRNEARHALKRLIVRACVSGKWGPPGCTGICDYCYNGGMCDDETGRCICPPGFMGENCLEECGGNKFGYSCEFECSSPSKDDACIGRQFCLIDPFGCKCGTGFLGLSCRTLCVSGMFGAGCLQRCHCSGSCDRFTGICDGICKDGWSGSNCQVPDICPNGYFGDNCTDKCRCVNEAACDRMTGRCPERRCAPGAMLDSHTSRCKECPDGFYGDSCKEICHCESDACDKVTGECVGCCKHEWVNDFRPICQQGFIESEPLEVNQNQAVEVPCTYTQHASTNYLILALSSTPDRYTRILGIDINLTRTDTIGDFLRFTYSFSPPIADSEVNFYCQLLNSQDDVLAWIETIVSISELPVLTRPPTSQFKNQSSITISWLPWEEGRDVGDPPIVAYIPYYRLAGDWINGSAVYPNETPQYDVDGLEPDTVYEFAIATVRDGPGGEGPMSPPVKVKTLCNEPSVVPTDVEATLTEMNAVNVSWKINSSSFSCSTLGYTIYLIADGDTEHPIAKIVVDGNITWVIVDDDLEPGQSYSFRVALTTDASSNEASSGLSNNISVMDDDPPTIIIFIIPAAVVLLLIILIVVLLFYRRERRRNKPQSSVPASFHNNTVSISDEGRDHVATQSVMKERPNIYEVTEKTPSASPLRNDSIPAIEIPPSGAVAHRKAAPEMNKEENESATIPDNTPYQNVQTVMPVSDLPLYLRENRGKIENEFQKLKKGQQFPWTVAANGVNSTKNRFRKMFAYDHSRVVLKNMPADCDYYNASHISDQNGEKSFIASQAPNTASLNDFWEMIWQEEVATIVMLTNLMENGKDRCHQYWPSNEGDSKVFGKFVVSWVETKRFAHYDVRELEVLQGREMRRLSQFHFTTWPDMGVPEPGPLLDLVKHVKLTQGSRKTRLLIHCSAGVGRTGTFIAVYGLMEVIKTEKNISVFSFVETARQSRVNMVQTEVQYVFIYQCLVNYYLTRHTEVPAGLLAQLDIDSKQDKIAEEFELLSAFEDDDKKPYMYENPLDKRKSRFPDIAPSMSGRIYLTSTAMEGFSNFINATMFTSVLRRNAYITTQSPLPDTIEDFWRLVYDWKCPLVVMLNQLDNNDEACVRYWPEEGSGQYGNMSVTFLGGEVYQTHVHRQFEVAHIEHRSTLIVHQLQLLGWPTNPPFTPIRDVRKTMSSMDVNTRAPTLVHCIDGVGRSGVFVAVGSALESVGINNSIDVFNTVREMRQRNRFVIGRREDYMLCYRIIKSLLSTDETYENL